VAQGGRIAAIQFAGKVHITNAGNGYPRITADTISFADVSLVLEAPAAPAFGTVPKFDGQNEFTIAYRNTTASIAEPIDSFPGAVIQIGNVVLPGGHWNITIARTQQEKLVAVEVPPVRSFLTTVWGPGTYRLHAVNGTRAGELLNAANGTDFDAISTRAFFPIAQLGGPAPTHATQTRNPALTPTVTGKVSPEPAHDTKGKISTGAIVGISIGGVAVIGAIVGVVLCCRPRHKDHKKLDSEAPPLTYTSTL
jgi:hypothetical protein